ncbi:MAG: hypothetical protein Q9167_007565 [Letrouitia subvulpina]
MLANADHYYWSDGSLDHRLSTFLGDSRVQCLRTLEHIEEILADIEENRNRLSKALEQETEQRDGKIPAKKWRRQIQEKLKFSFSESRLSENLSILTDFVHDFKTLRSSLETQRELSKAHGNHRAEIQSKELQLHRTIGEASQGVYEALQSACSKHIEHRAHLCIEVEQVSGNTVSTPQFKFNLAFASTAVQSEPFWFAVETMMNERVLETGQNRTLRTGNVINMLKRQLDSTAESSPPEKRKKKKSVRLQLPLSIAVEVGQVPPIGQSLALQNPIDGDFCDFLRRHCHCSYERGKNIGVLPNKTRWKSLVYPLQVKVNAQHLRPISLREIISLISQKDRLRLFSIPQRIHLAKMISIAFLRHHTTQWGRACSESESIYFFDMNEDVTDEPIRLTSPHLNTRICGLNGTPPASQKATALGARNALLFNLGVLFLEIAHSSNWQTMKDQHSSHHIGNQSRYEDFFLARKLAKLRSSGMPGRYHGVIEKLIECDFAQGDDLAKPELQAAFHHSVIKPLEEVEARLKELDIDE